jgi:hypothetical protein
MKKISLTSPNRSLPRLAVVVASSVVTGMVLAGCSATPAPTVSTPVSTPAPSATASESNALIAAANAFAATLSSSQQSSLNLPYTLTSAKAWSNLPQSMSRNRVGVQLSTLDETQRAALGALLKVASGTQSGEGYDEIQQLLNADDYLAAHGGGSAYGSGNYFVAFLGSPSTTGTWELQFGGHHLAFANTYINGVLVGATPSFRGVEPFGSFEQAGVTNAPLDSEQKALSAVLTSLSSSQQAEAKLSKTYSDLLLRPGNDWAFPTTREGVKVSTLSADQKALVTAAIATYVNDVDDASAASIMAKYTSELDETYVSFSGSTSLLQQNDYMRIDGPSVWIEFSMQRGIVLSGNHPHSVWRDRVTDYGGTKS